MSEIIFWRHAEAHDADADQDDLSRKLTVKGQRQAERVAFWLDRNLPQQCKVFVSEAKRAQQTARFELTTFVAMPHLTRATPTFNA